MERIYLDNAATTAMDFSVIEEMTKVMQNDYGNPSSIHTHGRQVRALIEKARRDVAKLINASPSEIFFTSGGTEADNTAIRSAILTYQIKHAITSKLEHHAVGHTLSHMLQNKELESLSYVKVDTNGNIDLEHLEQLLKDHPKSLVSLMHANNEIGTLSDMDKIGNLCEQYDAIYHCDTVQTMGHYRHDVKKLKAHFLVCSAHKLHGPKGVGFLYVNQNIKINPLILGGAQERNMRGGTENIYGIIGLSKALSVAYGEMEAHQNHIQGLKSYMIAQLKKHFEGVEFNGETTPEKSLYTVLNVSFPEMPMSELLIFNLDIHGISASGGSACSSGSNQGSHVLTAIGGNPKRPAVRFSFSKFNQKEEIDEVIGRLHKIFQTKL